ncbi:MAG TPA: helix-turn-helix domain-containing protein [Armatimonadota bacterium]|nr:helix-turn-helix domain-containing protein [Armatimonadota bacterium]
MAESDLLTLRQAIEHLNMSRSTFLRVVKAGKIKRFVFADKTIRYSRQDLDDYKAASRETDSQGSPEE